MGSALTRHLAARGVEVHTLTRNAHDRLDLVLDSDRIHSTGADPRMVEDIVRSIQPDAIFHLASVQRHPDGASALTDMLNCNLALGTHLLYAAARSERRPVFVNTGSYWQFDEQGLFFPNTLYAATKQAFTDLVTYYVRWEGLAALTLVLYDTFGPDDPRPKIWSRIINAEHGEHIPLTKGVQLVELVHIDDVVRAFEMAANLLISGQQFEPLYCVRSNRRITLRTLLELFSQHSGKELSFGWGEVAYTPGQIFRPWQGPLLPDWQPRTSIDASVEEHVRQVSRRHDPGHKKVDPVIHA